MATAKKLPSGRWRIQIFIRKDENGKNIMKSFTADTRWQAEKYAAEFIENNKAEQERFTVAQALDGYIGLKENVLSPSTIRGYGIIRRNRLQRICFGRILRYEGDRHAWGGVRRLALVLTYQGARGIMRSNKTQNSDL